MEKITQWVEGHQALVQQLGSVSLIVLAITVVALPVVIIKLPQDYFTEEKREPASQTRKRPVLWAFLSVLKNLVGILLILVGLAMLVLPGQGTVTILIGLALTNFPGKYALEQRIVRQPAIGKTLNRIRELGGVLPLSVPSEPE